MQSKRRFIAGAVCPRCAVMDRIVMFEQNDERFRECVSCGFQEKLVDDESMREPETRVSKERKVEAAVQPLKFFPSPKKPAATDKPDDN